MKIKNIFLFIILFGDLFMLAQASLTNEFTDGTTEGNLTFNKSQDIIKFINISSDSTVKNATIDLRGYNYSTQFEINKISIGKSNCKSGDIFDWIYKGTQCNCADVADISCRVNITGNLLNVAGENENYTFAITSSMNADHTTTLLLNISLYNFTSNRYETLSFCQSTCPAVGSSTCNSHINYSNLVSDYLQNGKYNYSIIMIVIDSVPGGGGGSDATKLDSNTGRYFLTHLISNFTVDTGNDTLIDYNNGSTQTFNGTIDNLDLNTTAMNNWIDSNCPFGYCNLPIVFSSNTAGILEYSNINITQNDLPNATNVSITPVSITQRVELTDLKGHANYSDIDDDVAGGNQTLWYKNGKIINTANNSFTLLQGNVTYGAEIIFSARFNDTYDWSDWVNSSHLNVTWSIPKLRTHTIGSYSTIGGRRIISC